MLLGRFVGLRALWLIAAGWGWRAVLFASIDLDGARAMQLFLIGMQVVIVGLNFVFWAMLPNTIEFGERETGVTSKARCSASPPCCRGSPSELRRQSSAGASLQPAMLPTFARARRRLPACAQTIALVPLRSLRCPALRWLLEPAGRTRAAAASRRSARRCRDSVTLGGRCDPDIERPGFDDELVLATVEARSAARSVKRTTSD